MECGSGLAAKGRDGGGTERKAETGLACLSPQPTWEGAIDGRTEPRELIKLRAG